jgi:hypothetical protein
VKYPCNRCRNRRMLSEYEISDHIAKHGFMPSYLVPHEHGEVQTPTAAESDGSNVEDRIDDMITYIGMKYELGSTRIDVFKKNCMLFWKEHKDDT